MLDQGLAGLRSLLLRRGPHLAIGGVKASTFELELINADVDTANRIPPLTKAR